VLSSSRWGRRCRGTPAIAAQVRTAGFSAHLPVGPSANDPIAPSLQAAGSLKVPSSVEMNANFTKNGPLYLAYNTDTLFVMEHVERAWNQIRAGMRKLYYSSNPRPSNASDIFIPDVGGAAGEIKLIVKPIIFHLPERANRQDANLFIVVSGRLSFDSANWRSLPLKTRRFETKVGYFRAKGRSLEHVYGAHYDLDETQPGHPDFHSQMAPQHCFGTKIIDAYIFPDRQTITCRSSYGTCAFLPHRWTYSRSSCRFALTILSIVDLVRTSEMRSTHWSQHAAFLLAPVTVWNF
jgi:hypothetical protein